MSIKDRVASYLNIPPDSKQAVTITDEKLCEIGASVASLEREAAVVEFLTLANEKYFKIQHRHPIIGREYAAKEAFREMFHKELDG